MAQKKVTLAKQSTEFSEEFHQVDKVNGLARDVTSKRHVKAKKGFKTKSNSYIKYILNIKRSKLAYIILLLVITPKVIWMTRELIPETAILMINFKSAVNGFIANLDYLILNLFKI